jgi:hypothetical protein
VYDNRRDIEMPVHGSVYKETMLVKLDRLMFIDWID